MITELDFALTFSILACILIVSEWSYVIWNFIKLKKKLESSEKEFQAMKETPIGQVFFGKKETQSTPVPVTTEEYLAPPKHE